MLAPLVSKDLKLNKNFKTLSSKKGSKSKLNKGEQKIVEIMRSKEIVPKLQTLEEIKRKRIELISREKYEDLEKLTNKSIELYKFFNRRQHHGYSSLEKTERIQRHNRPEPLTKNSEIKNTNSSLMILDKPTSLHPVLPPAIPIPHSQIPYQSPTPTNPCLAKKSNFFKSDNVGQHNYYL